MRRWPSAIDLGRRPGRGRVREPGCRWNADEGSIGAAPSCWRAIDRGENAARCSMFRSEAEFGAGHVPGAVNIPFNQVSVEDA